MRISAVLVCLDSPSLAQSSIDTDSIATLMDVAYELEATNPDSAIALYQQTYVMALASGDTLNAGRSLQYKGIVFSERERLDSAEYYYRQALPLFQRIGHQRGIGSTYVNLGNVAQFRADYEQAIDYYLQSIPYFEQAQDTSSIAITYSNIGSVFNFIGQTDRALSYYERSLELSKAIGDSVTIADVYINMSKNYIALQDTASAIDQLQQVIQYSEPSNNVYFLMLAYDNLADLYMNVGDLEQATSYARSSLYYARQNAMPYYTISALIMAARTLIQSGSYSPALDTLRVGLQLEQSIKSYELRAEAYELAAQAYVGLGNYRQAYEQFKLHKQYSDSIFNESRTRTLNDLERKYEAEKKSRQLADQQLLTTQQEEDLNRQRSLLILVVSVSLLLVLAVGFLFYYLKQRRRLYQQQLLVVKRENELQSVKALITGEEKERTRIAKELHDGLSGLLGSIKLRFSSFSQSLGTSQKTDYTQALGLLDDASREVRQISHNLMPEILLKFGLVEALRSYFNNINQSNTLQIDFQELGLKERLTPSLELTLYRIVQELVNNIIKHSNAKEVLVQISRLDHLLTVTVEDDGVGFSPEQASGGIGLESIRSRVDYLSGKLDIQSQQGKGTSVYMEFTLEKLQSA
ncbi:MAG: tetratricopeptide repeat protein [Bacteroidota bacterium]